GYFASAGTDSSFLHALSNTAAGGNGVFKYGSSGGFPTQTYNSSNYWVDVVFSQTTSDLTPPTVTAVSPANGTALPSLNAPITVTFSEDVQASSISLVVKDSSNNVVAGNLSYNGTTRIVTFTPSSPLLSLRTYTVTVSGVKDLSGNTLAAPYTWSFT